MARPVTSGDPRNPWLRRSTCRGPEHSLSLKRGRGQGPNWAVTLPAPQASGEASWTWEVGLQGPRCRGGARRLPSGAAPSRRESGLPGTAGGASGGQSMGPREVSPPARGSFSPDGDRGTRAQERAKQAVRGWGFIIIR